eukprot:3962485-Amphidinium_carterae.4
MQRFNKRQGCDRPDRACYVEASGFSTMQSTVVLDILRWSWYIETVSYYKCSMEMLTMLTEIASTKPIDRDTFNPATWDSNEDKHLWWAWFATMRN